MAVTLKEVAQRAGVSRSAVSRTFTEGASVSPKMRQKVEQAARELGYQPNALASSLTTGRTKLIGLVLNNFHNPAFLEIFDLFTRALQDKGLRPLLVNLTDETDPAASVTMLRQYSVDGVIVASSTLPPEFALAFRDAGLPVVHSFGRCVVDPPVHVVGIDNEDCGRIACRALVDRGYQTLGFLGGPEGATSTQDRLAGFLAEAKAHPKICAGHSFAGDYTFDAGRAEMQRLIAAGPRQAYFCADDILSIGALSAIQESGFQVGKDIGLIGLNDIEMAGWANINLTTIRQPISQIVATSVGLVSVMLDGKDLAPSTCVLPCEFVERGTLRAVDQTRANG